MKDNKLRWRLGNLISTIRYWDWRLDQATLAKLQFWLQEAPFKEDDH